MSRAYPQGLRERLMAAVESDRRVCGSSVFQVSISYVYEALGLVADDGRDQYALARTKFELLI